MWVPTYFRMKEVRKNIVKKASYLCVRIVRKTYRHAVSGFDDVLLGLAPEALYNVLALHGGAVETWGQLFGGWLRVCLEEVVAQSVPGHRDHLEVKHGAKSIHANQPQQVQKTNYQRYEHLQFQLPWCFAKCCTTIMMEWSARKRSLPRFVICKIVKDIFSW